jgi:hypothetical protein
MTPGHPPPSRYQIFLFSFPELVSARLKNYPSLTLLTKKQWVETNPSNIRFFPTDIYFYLVSQYYANSLRMSVCGCLGMLDGLVSSHPKKLECFQPTLIFVRRAVCPTR